MKVRPMVSMLVLYVTVVPRPYWPRAHPALPAPISNLGGGPIWHLPESGHLLLVTGPQGQLGAVCAGTWCSTQLVVTRSCI